MKLMCVTLPHAHFTVSGFLCGFGCQNRGDSIKRRFLFCFVFF